MESSYRIEPLIPGYSGDEILVLQDAEHLFFCVIDVLGHGMEANEIAVDALSYIKKNHHFELNKIVEGLHKHIQGTRGLVGLFGKIHNTTLELQYNLVGNITGRIIGQSNSRLVGKDGVIGYALPSLLTKYVSLSKGDNLIVYTDGIKEHFEFTDETLFFQNDIQNMANEICKNYGKSTDDKGCLVIKT